MGVRELLELPAPTPVSVANHLLGLIKDLEGQLSGSQKELDKIKNRPWYKQWVASGRDDLMLISTSQSAVNALMLQLIQEVLLLSSKSHAFLEQTIATVEARARTGWKDAEGDVQQLTDTGRAFADKVRGIFARFAENARDVKQQLAVHEAQTQVLAENLAHQQLQIDGLHGAQQASSTARTQQDERVQALDDALRESRVAHGVRMEALAQSQQDQQQQIENLQGAQQALATARAQQDERVQVLDDALRESRVAYTNHLEAFAQGQQQQWQQIQELQGAQQALSTVRVQQDERLKSQEDAWGALRQAHDMLHTRLHQTEQAAGAWQQEVAQLRARLDCLGGDMQRMAAQMGRAHWLTAAGLAAAVGLLAVYLAQLG